MNAPVNNIRLTTADQVVADFAAAERLATGNDPMLRQFGERALATLRGDRGLARSFLPMESERSPATIFHDACRNRVLREMRWRHFKRELDARAADGIRGILTRYRLKKKCGPHEPGSADDFCRLFFETGADIPSTDAIRKVLAGANPMI